jgi:uncharacterized protein YbjT (DUF2867 family)
MTSDTRKLIAVVGASGNQGSGVVNALKASGKFRVRALTRSPEKYSGTADEVVAADLTRPETLKAAFAGAYGVFAVTNFWAGPDIDELAQGEAAVSAARRAGVKHFVWSTLPNVERISGKFHVAHFTAKAKVDDIVAAAGFDHHTFVEAPFYFQNLVGQMAPQKGENGKATWNLPMTPDAKVIHMGDIEQLGTIVAGAFAHPDKTGAGQHLSLSGGLYSWADVVETLRAQGHDVTFNQVPAEIFDGFFHGAREIREMFNYFEAHTYFGPNANEKIALARAVATEPPLALATWTKQNMPAR